MRVRELAEWLGAAFEGDGEKELAGVAPGPRAASGWTRAVGATTADGSIGMNLYDTTVRLRRYYEACEFANWRNGWARPLRATAKRNWLAWRRARGPHRDGPGQWEPPRPMDR